MTPPRIPGCDVGHLVAVDPGLRKVGLAVYYNGQLTLATTVRSRYVGSDLGAACAAIADAVLAAVSPCLDSDPDARVTWVAESQQHYPGRSVAADLVRLTTATGWILGRCAGASPAHLVLPREWKGQAPKSVTRARAERALPPADLAAFAPTPAARASHDCWDAVALGAWALGMW